MFIQVLTHEVTGAARALVASRAQWLSVRLNPVLAFEADGTFVRGWGKGLFVRPQGISIGENDTLYLVDDMGHSVRQFSGEGELLRTIGPAGKPSDTGAQEFDYRTIGPAAGPPFNLPTNSVIGPGGDLFVTDGY